MNNKRRQVIGIAVGFCLLILTLIFIRDFRLSWVEVNEEYAKVTVNFLTPMDKEAIKNHVKVIGEREDAMEFECSVSWLTDYVACFKIKENNLIKGQNIKLVIDEAPTQYSWLQKSAKIKIPFVAKVKLLENEETQLIATTSSFSVHFNTAIKKEELQEYLGCDATFTVRPLMQQDANGKQVEDLTTFIFTPKVPLENGRNYILTFKKGLPARCGTFLEESQTFILATEAKPEIKNTYPKDGDQWIGLYPRFTLSSDSPIAKATLFIEGEEIIGTLTDNHHAVFLLENRLQPDTTYETVFRIQKEVGEYSEPKVVQFTTTTLKNERVWLEVKASKPYTVKCFKGEKLIKTMVCSLGENKNAPPLGTYYIQDKKEIYEDAFHKEGANIYLPITESCAFQGIIRDEYWNIKTKYQNELGATIDRSHIIVSEEDAKWLYRNIGIETMVIIRH